MTPVQQRPIVAEYGTYSAYISDSFASLPAIGSVVIVTGAFHSSASVGLIDDNQGHIYTVLQTPNSDTVMYVAYCVVTASSGTFTVKAVNSMARATMQISNWSASDLNTASLIGNYSVASTGILSRNATTTVTGQLAITAVSGNGSTGFGGDYNNPPSTFTAMDEYLASRCTLATAYKTCGSAGTETAAWTGTNSGDSYNSVLVLFMPAASSASDPAASSSRFTTSRHTFGTRR